MRVEGSADRRSCMMSPSEEVNLKADNEGTWTALFKASANPSSVTVPQAGSVTVSYTIDGISCEWVEAEDN
jgi:hypothetical protein